MRLSVECEGFFSKVQKQAPVRDFTVYHFFCQLNKNNPLYLQTNISINNLALMLMMMPMANA